MRFVCFGDWGMITKPLLSFMKEIGKWYKNYILLGDNFYPNGVNSVEDVEWNILELFPNDIDIYPVLGNHDYMGNPFIQIEYNKWKDRKRNWNMQWLFYDKKWIIENNTIHLICIDTQIMDIEYTKQVMSIDHIEKEEIYNIYKEKQIKWLHETLLKSRSKWKIVCGHYPIFSNGQHNKSNEIKRILLPIFNRYSVDIYLSGHDHIAEMHQYEKTIHIISGCIAEKRPYNNKNKGQYEIFRNSEKDHGVFDINIENINQMQVSYISSDKMATLFIYDLYKF